MKLNELFEPEISQATTKLPADAVRKRLQKDEYKGNALVKVIGSGSFGTVAHDEDIPGDVVKVSGSIKNPKNDGYLNFLSVIAKNDRTQSNPYFPKIYRIRLYRNEEENRYFYVVEMEKLYPLSQLEPEEIEALIDRMVHINSSGSGLHQNSTQDGSLDRLLYVIDKALGDNRHRFPDKERKFIDDSAPRRWAPMSPSKQSINQLTNIKDPKLKQAIMFLRGFIEKNHTNNYGTNNDMRADNVMFRRTSVGAQLVLVDPLA